MQEKNKNENPHLFTFFGESFCLIFIVSSFLLLSYLRVCRCVLGSRSSQTPVSSVRSSSLCAVYLLTLEGRCLSSRGLHFDRFPSVNLTFILCVAFLSRLGSQDISCLPQVRTSPSSLRVLTSAFVLKSTIHRRLALLKDTCWGTLGRAGECYVVQWGNYCPQLPHLSTVPTVVTSHTQCSYEFHWC